MLHPYSECNMLQMHRPLHPPITCYDSELGIFSPSARCHNLNKMLHLLGRILHSQCSANVKTTSTASVCGYQFVVLSELPGHC